MANSPRLRRTSGNYSIGRVKASVGFSLESELGRSVESKGRGAC